MRRQGQAMNEFRSIIRKYCQEHIEPFMEQDDETRTFRKEIFCGLGQLGSCGVTTSEKYGGAGLGLTDLCPLLEEIAKTSVPYAVTLSVSAMVQSIIESFGTEFQKEKYLPELALGQEIGAFALSEPGAGSDVKALKTVAKKKSGGYLLNGTKAWITSAGVAKTYIVMARTEEKISAFIVDNHAKGLSFGKEEKKIGWKVGPTKQLILENCFVPQENLLGQEGQGLKVALSGLDRGRITIGQIALGASKRVFEESLKYSFVREQFGEAIFYFQGIQFMLAEMKMEIEASETLIYKACKNFDQGKSDPSLAAMVKLKATEVCMKSTIDAVQIHGAVGITSEYPVERFLRDAKILQIVEGTSQIQKLVIAKSLQKNHQF